MAYEATSLRPLVMHLHLVVHVSVFPLDLPDDRVLSSERSLLVLLHQTIHRTKILGHKRQCTEVKDTPILARAY